jgi:hypothetical protein
LIKRVALASVVFAAVVSPAFGEIHDYMILRLVYLNTSCGTLSMERLDVPAPHARFKVTCKDATAYPDGLTIYCTDPDDDRLCHVETPAKTFDHLDLLQR